MSDDAERKAEKQRAKELLASDVNERTRRFKTRSTAVLVVGVALFVAAFFIGGGVASQVVAVVGALFVLLGFRARRALSAFAGIRAATEANGKSDHAEVERLLRAQLAQSQHVAIKLSLLDLLSMSLWKRGALSELDALLREHLRDGDRGNAGPFGEAYGRLHALALLARACRSGESIELEAKQIEKGASLDARAVTRLALARAVVAMRAGDPGAALRALDGFDHFATDSSAEDRVLGRALRALAKRGASSGEAYRGGSSIATGGAMQQWVAGVYAPAASFVEEQPLLAMDEPVWAKKPTAPPVALSVKRVGKRPLHHFQRAALIGGWLTVVISMLLVMDPTVTIAIALLGVGVVMVLVGLLLALVRRTKARSDTALLRETTAKRLAGKHGDALELLSGEFRDPSVAAVASLQRCDIYLSLGQVERALDALDHAFDRLAWFPQKGRETAAWAIAVLMRPRLLAMAGREQEAESALSFALMSVIEVSAGRGLLFSTRFWLALALRRREEAVELARTFDVRSPIDGRTELARDAVLAMGDPSAMQRVKARIDAWPEVRLLFDRVCPWIAEGWGEGAATGVRIEANASDAPSDSSAESHSVASGASDDQGRGGSTP